RRVSRDPEARDSHLALTASRNRLLRSPRSTWIAHPGLGRPGCDRRRGLVRRHGTFWDSANPSGVDVFCFAVSRARLPGAGSTHSARPECRRKPVLRPGTAWSADLLVGLALEC